MSGKEKAPKAPKPKKEKKGKKPEAEGEMNAEGEEGEGGAKKKKMAGKTLILFIVAPLFVLGLGGGAAAFFLLPKSKPAAHGEAKAGAHGEKSADAHGKDKNKKDGKDKKKGGHGEAKKKGGHGGGAGGDEANEAKITEGDGVYFYSLPEILVNIGGADGKTAYLKLKLTVEAAEEAPLTEITPQLPRVMDQFQGFLRELRLEDLNGSAGAYRLRLELLRRLNLSIAPQTVDAVLIEEMLIQ